MERIQKLKETEAGKNLARGSGKRQGLGGGQGLGYQGAFYTIPREFRFILSGNVFQTDLDSLVDHEISLVDPG